jgi:hypothetical protein
MTNAPSGAGDRYYVYCPVLDLIGLSEDTDRGDGYNETLGYGIMLDGRVSKGKGTDIVLTSITLDQVDKLQTRMLKDPDNRKLNSSAVGRYQIVRTTLRKIRDALDLPGTALFDADMQDRMACFLLGQRGIDKYLSGRLSEDTLLTNFAKEWASLPQPNGKGYYGGQRAAVTPAQVRKALAEVRRRHIEGQPVERVVPETVEKAVKKQTNGWGWSGIGFGGLGAALTAIAGWPWQIVALFAGIAIAGGLIALVIGPWIVRRVKAIRAEVTA